MNMMKLNLKIICVISVVNVIQLGKSRDARSASTPIVQNQGHTNSEGPGPGPQGVVVLHRGPRLVTSLQHLMH